MILKNQVEWALHCCAVLAGLPAERYLSAKALAAFHGVPGEYLSKALQALSRAGIVESTLGPAGGYRLGRPAREITFLDVVEAVEGKKPTFVCTEIRRNNPCRPAGTCDPGPCAIARIMGLADEAWREKLRSVTLAELTTLLAREVPEAIYRESFAWLLAAK